MSSYHFTLNVFSLIIDQGVTGTYFPVTPSFRAVGSTSRGYAETGLVVSFRVRASHSSCFSIRHVYR